MQDTVGQLYERSQRRLRAVASRYVGDEAEDVVQDAFVKALRYGVAFRGDAAPLTWVSRIVVNASIDRCRRRRRWEHVYPHVVQRRATAATALEDTFGIRTALRRLTREQRQVFILYHVLGYTHLEIARRLAIPPGTSKSRLSDARRRMRESLVLRT